MKIGTHNGIFHADDCFAVAAILSLSKGPHEIVRTRDDAVLDTCDVVVDVGGVHAPARGRFDHHQRGGAGKRENGVPFSSFGLIWQHFGAAICGDDERVAAKVDCTLVQSVDAADCGIDLQGAPLMEGVRSFSVSGAISLLNPTWEEEGDFDGAFASAVEMAELVLRRAIASARGSANASATIAE